ncbi:MAG: ketol-acid reductoisomerase [Candidatus Eisenbacteria sp.]|nr:ketol-acid reductoisomerase [Candidatus Eisenbacteria bacterium]
MNEDMSGPRFFDEADGNVDLLRSRKIAILGYGNQGRAQALNLRDSGIAVTIGLRKNSPSIQQVRKDGLKPDGLAEAVRFSDLVMILVPDEVQGVLFRDVIRAELQPETAIGFSHGFALRFGRVSPPTDVDVVLVAPKGPGSALRSNYLRGGGLPALVAVENDATGDALAVALAYAGGIGCLRCGVMETSAAMEAEADLFGEQSVLCGGISALAEAAFETLVDAGYPPELAYIECVQEIKAMVDRMFELGPEEMWEGASGTARYGGLTRGPVLIASEFRARLRSILEDIRSGRFADEWLERAGRKDFRWEELRPRGRPIDRAGRSVRNQLKWRSPEVDL